MLEEFEDTRGFLDYILNFTQYWNELRGWIIGVGVVGGDGIKRILQLVILCIQFICLCPPSQVQGLHAQHRDGQPAVGGAWWSAGHLSAGTRFCGSTTAGSGPTRPHRRPGWRQTRVAHGLLLPAGRGLGGCSALCQARGVCYTQSITYTVVYNLLTVD